MADHYLDFEKPIAELQKKIEDFEKFSRKSDVDMTEEIANVRKRIPFNLETVDITTDPDLFETYKERIPVVLVNGEETAVYRISEKHLTRKLRACSPRPSRWFHLRRKPT